MATILDRGIINKSFYIGLGVGVVVTTIMWLTGSSGSGRYQVSTAGAVHVIDMRTGEVWVRTDVPPGWTSLGRPFK